jgi:hypothetical protein
VRAGPAGGKLEVRVRTKYGNALDSQFHPPSTRWGATSGYAVSCATSRSAKSEMELQVRVTSRLPSLALHEATDRIEYQTLLNLAVNAVAQYFVTSITRRSWN